MEVNILWLLLKSDMARKVEEKREREGGLGRGKSLGGVGVRDGKRNIITELCRATMEKTVFTWYRHTHLAEYISGFLLLWIGDGFFGGWGGWIEIRSGVSNGFCMWCGTEWLLWELKWVVYFRRRKCGEIFGEEILGHETKWWQHQ